MAKSPEAFRTISEVSALLETPAHVLRFWESKFPQVKPVKRAGGRRYYRPDDVQLLGGIKVLLHERGMTIRGVQKILREDGARHVAGLAPPLRSDEDLDGVPFEEVDGLDEAGDVIRGPWSGAEGEAGPGAAEEAEPEAESLVAEAAAEEAVEAEEAFDLLAEDGLDAGAAAAEDELAPPLVVNGSAADAPSPLASFIAGTIRHVAASAPGAAPVASAGDPPAEATSDGDGPGSETDEPTLAGTAGTGEAAEPDRDEAPLPPGPPSPERAMALLRRADPERLRARADRIGPLLARLRALQAGLPRPGA